MVFILYTNSLIMKTLNILILSTVTIGILSGCVEKTDKTNSSSYGTNASVNTLSLKLKQNLVINPGFEKLDLKTNLPEGWLTKSPREEISPDFQIDKSVTHSGKVSARIISKGSPGTFGYWLTKVKFLQSDSISKEYIVARGVKRDSDFLSNKSYRVSTFFKTKGIESLSKSIWIRINWLDNNGKEVFSEFLSSFSKEDDWYRVEQVVTAPRAATSFNLELALQWTAEGTVWWDDVSVEETTSPIQRWIKVAASSSAPSEPSTPEKNRMFYADKIIKAGKLGVDLLCLGECITVVSTDKKATDVAEPVPGPTSQILGEAARKAKLYVVASINEREGSLIYNTALLIDRNGNVAGKYRKTHLPQSEVYNGITPGTSYPVFQTDFGKVGIEICYDNLFPEVTSNLASQGAEIILLPTWGDTREQGYAWDIVARARAIDNGVYLVASEYGHHSSLIFHPTGRIIENADNVPGLITAKIYINSRSFEPWLSFFSYGDWKNLFPRERHTETYKGLLKDFYDSDLKSKKNN
jgi:predicted amidohydrolase